MTRRIFQDTDLALQVGGGGGNVWQMYLDCEKHFSFVLFADLNVLYGYYVCNKLASLEFLQRLTSPIVPAFRLFYTLKTFLFCDPVLSLNWASFISLYPSVIWEQVGRTTVWAEFLPSSSLTQLKHLWNAPYFSRTRTTATCLLQRGAAATQPCEPRCCRPGLLN